MFARLFLGPNDPEPISKKEKEQLKEAKEEAECLITSAKLHIRRLRESNLKKLEIFKPEVKNFNINKKKFKKKKYYRKKTVKKN